MAILAVPAIAVLVIAIVAGGRWRRPLEVDGTARTASPEASALLVRSLRVSHRSIREDEEKERGDIGVGSFATLFGDQVRISAQMSEAAHCFLLAMNPNGKEQCLWPADDETPPPAVERVEFPAAGLAINLDDEPLGGMQAFVVVASRRPLPAYAEWKQTRPSAPWERLPAEAGVVWRGDGDSLEAHLPGGDQRASVSEVKGVHPLAVTVQRLRSADGVEAVSVVAFAVLPRNPP